MYSNLWIHHFYFIRSPSLLKSAWFGIAQNRSKCSLAFLLNVYKKILSKERTIFKRSYLSRFSQSANQFRRKFRRLNEELAIKQIFEKYRSFIAFPETLMFGFYRCCKAAKTIIISFYSQSNSLLPSIHFYVQYLHCEDESKYF